MEGVIMNAFEYYSYWLFSIHEKAFYNAASGVDPVEWRSGLEAELGRVVYLKEALVEALVASGLEQPVRDNVIDWMDAAFAETWYVVTYLALPPLAGLYALGAPQPPKLPEIPRTVDPTPRTTTPLVEELLLQARRAGYESEAATIDPTHRQSAERARAEVTRMSAELMEHIKGIVQNDINAATVEIRTELKATRTARKAAEVRVTALTKQLQAAIDSGTAASAEIESLRTQLREATEEYNRKAGAETEAREKGDKSLWDKLSEPGGSKNLLFLVIASYLALYFGIDFIQALARKLGLITETKAQKDCGSLPGLVIGAALGFAVLSSLIQVKPEHVASVITARIKGKAELEKAKSKELTDLKKAHMKEEADLKKATSAERKEEIKAAASERKEEIKAAASERRAEISAAARQGKK